MLDNFRTKIDVLVVIVFFHVTIVTMITLLALKICADVVLKHSKHAIMNRNITDEVTFPYNARFREKKDAQFYSELKKFGQQSNIV